MSTPGPSIGGNESTAVGAGLDHLASYLGERLGATPEVVSIRRLNEGHSNLTYLVTCGEDRYVLRRPPLGPLPPSAHDVLREHRVLTLLEGRGARTPRTVLACADPTVFGAPFYLMQYVDGVVLRDSLPAEFDAADAAADISAELIDALVELHQVDWKSTGFGELASDNGYLDRQLRLWRRQWDHNRTRTLEDVETVGAWLEAARPAESAVTIVHGDYKIDNLIFALRDGRPHAEAIVDWEMATLGDPLADLGFLTAVWSEPGEDPAVLLGLSQITTTPGFDSRSGLARRYAERTGHDLRHLRWYQVLAVWKLAILLEGSYKRHVAGTTDDSWFEGLAAGVPMLLQRAGELTRTKEDW
jgi:aminoglycoside phosphotransferase (APT) family kinase protein